MEYYSVLLPLALIMGGSKILSKLCEKLNLPQVVGMLLTGVIIGFINYIPNQQILTETSMEGIGFIAKLGVILIMFSAGLETDIKQIKSVGAPAMVITLAGVAVPMGLGFVVACLFNGGFNSGYETMLDNLFYGVVLTATSVSVTVATLKELGKLNSKVGSTVIAAAIIDDIIGVIVLSFVIAMKGDGTNSTPPLKIVIMTALFFAGVMALRIAPHALQRFSVWRHVWEYPLDAGYQQTKSLMCIASGGLLGLGAGNGWLKNVFAADSDIVFATISEEWGLIQACMLVACVAVFGFFAVRTARVARSSFYSIGACTAAGILVIQTILNCLGTVDILPFTGVTFPFLSNGGTSMIGSWGLLAFVKAADTRQNASFAVKLSKKGRQQDE